MRCRRAEIDEISQLVELRKQQLIDEGMEPIKNIDDELKNFFELNIKNRTLISWVAENEGIIVATSGVCFYQLPPSYYNPSGKIAYITNVYTKNEYRGRGIASDLLELAIDEAKKQNCKIARLHASKHGKSLYKRFGFKDFEDYMMMQL